jgi:hypothetical protein
MATTTKALTGKWLRMDELYRRYLVDLTVEYSKQFGFVQRCHVKFLYRAHEAGF